MQNIVELTSGECELFDKAIHLNQRTLKKDIDSFIFIQNSETNSKQSKENQAKLQIFLDE